MIIKGGYMKKKLLVLLIAVIPTLMPNLASAIEIEIEMDAGEISTDALGCLLWPFGVVTCGAPSVGGR